MIIFEKLRYCNFLSCGNSFIEFVLNKHDTTLIVGANGSGKSTLLDALSFVLFGKAYRKINKSQLVNSITGKNCLVEVEFSVGETKYLIRRGINPNLFEVYQDERLLNQQANSRDYQEILEEQIIKTSHKSFCQIVILGIAAYEPFMQLTTAQRREVIEDLLDLQVFTVMNLDLKERASQTNQMLLIKGAEKQALTQQLELLQHHATVLETDREQIYAEKANKLKSLQTEYDDLVVDARNVGTALEQHLAKIEDEHKIAKKINELRDYKYEAASKRDEAKKGADFMVDHVTCPTCTRDMDEEFRYSKIEEYRGTEAHYVKNVTLISNELTTKEKRLSEISTVKEKIQDWKLDLQVMKSRKASLIKQMEEVRKDVESLSKAHEITKDVPKVEKALGETSRSCVDLEETKKILSYAALLLKDTGIKSKIIKQYVPIINSIVNGYLSRFELFCKFTLDEQFNEVIKSRGRDDFSYESFSQGERMRIDLAILFAWREISRIRNTINTNILILDEVFDASLDEIGVDCLIDIIKSFSQRNNVIIISHKDQMFDKFEHCVRVSKKRNFSNVKVN